MFRDVSSRVNFPEIETRILAFWKEREIFAKSIEQRRDAPEFVFYEGPPTANGRPGVHHVLARVFKDLFPRYKTMKGYRSERKGGWDTHGLPVELEVEKELGLTSKRDIDAYGVAEFNARCKESVFRYVQDWEKMTDRIGFWIDMTDPYVTFHNGYIESCWWILKQFWENGLIYRDYKVTPHCPRCGTSLSSHEVALGYDEADDPSVYVRFRLLPGQSSPAAALTEALAGDRPVSLLVWTTTPWTLPANVAAAVNRSADYALVESVGADGQPEYLVLAAARVEAVTGGRAAATFPGSALIGLRYQPLFPPASPPEQPAWRVVAGDMVSGPALDDEPAKPFVSLEDGTGIVHLAPAYGAIDLEVGRAENLPLLHTVDLKGEVTGVDPAFDGRFIKDADPLITERLRERGLLYRAERYLHRYPFCWRCSTPLIYYAKTSWYIRTTARKAELLRNNSRINWYPEHIKEGRFGNWLANNVDWAFSRERYWGTPIPIYSCESCGAYDCIGSVRELEERSGRDLSGLDLHRPYVDEVTIACASCGGTARRIPEVCDAWFDSGAMPVAQWHYPFENEETFRKKFPADFICEGIDQTRGWFYTLLAVSTLLFDEPCYRNVICLGLILDAKGEKMSKSRGNVVDPWTILNVQGADALRWYLYTAAPPGNARRFSAELVDESLRKFLLTLWNTYVFFVTYANLDRWTPGGDPGQRSDLDRWVLAELHRTVQTVTERLDQFDPTDAGRAIEAFVDRLSNWYVRRSRRRFWKSENDADKAAAYATLYECLVTTAKLLAPFTPFVAEELYQNLVRSHDASAPESVHLCDYPVADEQQIDRQLLNDVALVMRIVSLGRAARAKANLKVRQPLRVLYVRPKTMDEEAVLTRLSAQITEELNVKQLAIVHDAGELFDYRVRPNFPVLGPRLGKAVQEVAKGLEELDVAHAVRVWQGGGTVMVAGHTLGADDVVITAVQRPGVVAAEEDGYVVGIATDLTPDLIAEGQARELVHLIQTMRRNAGFEIADRIETAVSASPTLTAVIDRFADYIAGETLSVRLGPGEGADGAYRETHEIDGEPITIALRRV
ncbi:MAG: isoleucine--tRNA ligase [Chloroflexota bacterium]|nr:isoleucine--tRNA ligase [Dehalococcoidia bacterium]MDW8252535.1 isoleucine--tRNA ligase [Chloroflexota bacterium]